MLNSDSFDIPILLITFNRIHTTKRVFEKIREQKPKRLYLASDGAREHKNGEYSKVQKVREFLINNIDWECEVQTLFQKTNLGCNYGPHNAITWFFEHEEQGIILEDDCVPTKSFFMYCENLLNYYKLDLRVFTIGGFNSLNYFNTNESYFFTKLPMIWGWATWRNRWNSNLETLHNFKEIVKNPIIDKITSDISVSKIIKQNALQAYNNEADSWDYIWTFTCFINNALCTVPHKNLIENIGFGPDSTHTSTSHENKKIIAYEIDQNLIHPKIILPDLIHDNFVYKDVLNWKSLNEKITDPNHIFKVLRSRFS